MMHKTTAAIRTPYRLQICNAMFMATFWRCTTIPLVSHAQSAPRPDAVKPDGGRYYGTLVDGIRQGHGRVEWDSGMRYEGSFEKSIFSVTGTYKRPDGTEHRGQFAKWRPHGVGVYTDAKGNVYEATFTDGALNGLGRLLGKDGSRYDGDSKIGSTRARVSFAMPWVTNTNAKLDINLYEMAVGGDGLRLLRRRLHRALAGRTHPGDHRCARRPGARLAVPMKTTSPTSGGPSSRNHCQPASPSAVHLRAPRPWFRNGRTTISSRSARLKTTTTPNRKSPLHRP